jgi:hypothetical protein
VAQLLMCGCEAVLLLCCNDSLGVEMGQRWGWRKRVFEMSRQQQ